MAWGRKATPEPPQEAAPVVVKTPEQPAEERAAGKAEWDECNPLRRWLITFMDGKEHTVTAHRCSDGNEFSNGRLLFLRTRYGVTSPFGKSYLSEVVYWTRLCLVHSVKMLDD